MVLWENSQEKFQECCLSKGGTHLMEYEAWNLPWWYYSGVSHGINFVLVYELWHFIPKYILLKIGSAHIISMWVCEAQSQRRDFA